MVRLFKSEMNEINAKGCKETQIQHTAQSSIAGSTNGVDVSRVVQEELNTSCKSWFGGNKNADEATGTNTEQ